MSNPRGREVRRVLVLVCSVLALASCSDPGVPGIDGGPSGADVAPRMDAITTDATDATDAPTGAPDGDVMAPDGAMVHSVARHSSSLALAPDGMRLYVANADADSVSVIDLVARTLVREIPLGTTVPTTDPFTHRYDVAVGPRALALAPHGGLLYVTGQRSGEILVLDVSTGTITARLPVCSEPVGVLVSPDEQSVYVACSQDDSVVQVDTLRRRVTATAHTARHPWSLAWSADGAGLYVTQLLGSGLPTQEGTGVTVLAPQGLAVLGTWTVPGLPHSINALTANGEVRGLYDIAVRPGTGDLWIPHLLLATGTAQAPVPTPSPGSDRFLDFENTVFPTVSVLHPDGSFVGRMTAVSRTLSQGMGDFGDIVSGPHAVEFTPDGRYALVLNASSDDLVAVDATRRIGVRTLHPLPGHLVEGMVLSSDGTRAYLDARNTSTVIVVDVNVQAGGIFLTTDGDPIPRIAHDPMPANLRLGQRMFFAADSDDLATTQNHWVACASCHIEARSDAVTWRFAEGPRDTPSNAGGMLGTGFLFRTGDRQRVRDYWHAITDEQGSAVYDPMNPGHTADHDTRLQALEDFVNYAIPFPVPPHTDPSLVARGAAIFQRADVGCASCHTGPRLTDSGMGNPTLDLAGTVLLHDVGTCVTSGVYTDLAHTDDSGHPRAACLFDTPSLRGVWDSAPYLHDGSAATLDDVLQRTRGHMGDIRSLSPADLSALVEYLRSL